jgi:hypothetical protein
MSALLYAAGGIVLVGGAAVGGYAYWQMQQQQDGDDDPDTDADTAETEESAEIEETDGLDIDRPEPEFSTFGAIVAALISLIPDPERGVVASARELINRPTPDHSKIGAIAAAAVSVLPKPLLGVRETLFRRLTLKSLKNYHKTGGGDALGLIAEPGQNIDIRPIKYRSEKECDDHERPGWVEKGSDKVWHAGAEGRVVDYIGDTPVVALERDSHVEAGWLKPRIGQAVELDNYDSVFVNPKFDTEVVGNIDLDAGVSTNGNAVADGGQGVVNVEVEDMGTYAGAEVVDLDSGDGYDGMRVDFRKASAWAFETTATEEMQMQQERGRLMGMMSGENGPSVAKLLLICAAIILGTLLIVFAVPEFLSNGGGGGGGGINPLMLAGGLL